MVLRSTATSCRSTRSSTSLVEVEQINYSRRSDTAAVMPNHRRPPITAGQLKYGGLRTPQDRCRRTPPNGWASAPTPSTGSRPGTCPPAAAPATAWPSPGTPTPRPPVASASPAQDTSTAHPKPPLQERQYETAVPILKCRSSSSGRRRRWVAYQGPRVVVEMSSTAVAGPGTRSRNARVAWTTSTS